MGPRLLQVQAGAEIGARAAQDHGANLMAPVEADEEIAQLRAIAGEAILVTTEKDFVRLSTAQRQGIKVLKIAAVFDDLATMECLLDRLTLKP